MDPAQISISLLIAISLSNSRHRRGTPHIYGTLVVEDGLGLFNQEPRLAHISQGYGTPEQMKLQLIDTPMVPGTWMGF